MKLASALLVYLFSINLLASTTVKLNAGLNIRECAGTCHFPTTTKPVLVVLNQSSNSFSGHHIFEVPEINGLRFVASLFVVKSIVNNKVQYKVEGHLTTFKPNNTDYTFKYFGSVVVDDLSKLNLKWYTDIHDDDKSYAVVVAIAPDSQK